MSTSSTQQGSSPAVPYFRAFSFKDNSGWTPGGAAWYEGICGFRNIAIDTRYSVSGWVLMHAGDSSSVYVGNISGMNGEYNVYWKDIKDAYIKQYDSINTEALEIYHATPFIDFHFNKSSADYTSRIIEQASGTLTVTGKLNVNSTLSQGGTPVALSGHTHDNRYFTESEITNTLQKYATTVSANLRGQRYLNIGILDTQLISGTGTINLILMMGTGVVLINILCDNVSSSLSSSGVYTKSLMSGNINDQLNTASYQAIRENTRTFRIKVDFKGTLNGVGIAVTSLNLTYKINYVNPSAS